MSAKLFRQYLALYNNQFYTNRSAPVKCRMWKTEKCAMTTVAYPEMIISGKRRWLMTYNGQWCNVE
jgi:hypothetical protein